MTRKLHFGNESRLHMPPVFNPANAQLLRAGPAASTAAPIVGEQYREVRLDAIVGDSPLQSRQPFDPEQDDEDRALLDSLAEDGQRVPVLVVEVENSQPRAFTLLDGHRRVAALRLLGRDSVRAVIYRHGSLDCDLVALTANVRKHLAPIEQARAIARLQERHSLTRTAIAQKAGITPQYLRQLLHLLETDSAVQQALDRKTMSAAAARALGGAPARQQPELARVVAENALSGPDARRLVERVVEHGQPVDDAARSLGLAGGTPAVPEPQQGAGKSQPPSRGKKRRGGNRKALTPQAASSLLASFLPEIEPEPRQALAELAAHNAAGAKVLKLAGLLTLSGWDVAEAASASDGIARTREAGHILAIAQACADLQGLIAKGRASAECAPLLAAIIRRLTGLKQAALKGGAES